MPEVIGDKRLKVLLVIEQCNPDIVSVPLVGYQFYRELDKVADITLVTHSRNQAAFSLRKQHKNVVFIHESKFNIRYYKTIVQLALKDGKTTSNGVNWPLYHALGYPIYAEFSQKVYQRFRQDVLNNQYDIVHGITPMMPRYPFKIVEACRTTPFLLGPVNGGIPFPKNFVDKARQEKNYLNFLRVLGRNLIPGYVRTYKQASRILTGSTYTMSLLQKMFNLPQDKIGLFYENGLENYWINPVERKDFQENNRTINLLFVGRLVPYKCADIVVKSVHQLKNSVKNRVKLTIIGSGPEQLHLQHLAQSLGLSPMINFTGFVSQPEIVRYYREADIFCFPSIREFGGAVVLEAMASGLPCIVTDYGGIGEYVTDQTGFKIAPESAEYLIHEMKTKIELLVENPNLWQQMSSHSIERAKEFLWEKKARGILNIYQELVLQKS